MDEYCIAATLFRFLFFSVEKKNDMNDELQLTPLYFCFGLHPRSAQLLLRRKVETERHSLALPSSVACLNKTPLCKTALTELQ